MHNVTFQEVGMVNYGPYIEPMILQFTNNTITMLTGPNGIGKTTAIDAIPFTFYGITSKGAKGDELVNNVVGKNCKTWVKFSVDDEQYEVIRYQKYKSRGNSVVLTNIKDKKRIDLKSGHREVVPEIEKLVCQQKSFMNTLMFGQKVKDFFTDLIDSDKKEIFRKILLLEQYVEYYKIVDKKIKELAEIIAQLTTQQKVKEGLLTDCKIQIELLKELEKKFYEDQKEKLINLKKEIGNNQRLLKTWISEFNNLSDVTTDKQKLIHDFANTENELNNLDKKYKSIVDSLKMKLQNKKYEIKESANKALKNLIEELAEKEKDIFKGEQAKQTELHKFVQAKQTEIFEVTKVIDTRGMLNYDHQSKIDEITDSNILGDGISSCPTCKQVIDKKIRNTFIEKIKNYQQLILENDIQIKSLDDKKDALRLDISKKSDSISKDIDLLKMNYERLREKKKQSEKEINDRVKSALSQVDFLADEKLTEIKKEGQAEKEGLLEKHKELLEVKKKLEAIETKKKTIQGYIDDITNQIKVLEQSIVNEEKREYNNDQLLTYLQRDVDLRATLKEIEGQERRHNKRLKILQFWKTAFSASGIPSMLIDESIPFMNKKVSEYLEMLTNGRYLVSFDTLAETKAGDFRDKISVRVLDTYTKANTRVQLSGGQTRLIDIATILTLGDLQSTIQDVKINLLLFDEIFDSLDEENIGYVSKVLNKIKKDKSIVIISHQHPDQVEADNTLAFT